MSESQLRRRARKQGLHVVKYPERSRWFATYGPYALVDERNYIVDFGLERETLEAWLTA